MGNAAIPANSVAQIMDTVLLALIPGTLVFCYLTGWGGVFNVVLAITSCLIIECLVARLRQLPMLSLLADRTGAVTGLLIALCLPPLVPYWLPVAACAIALLIGKHCYGGLGNNIFNPAMVGYAAMLVSFPAHLSQWPALPEAFATTPLEALNIIFSGGLLNLPPFWDGVTGATVLDSARQQTIDATLPISTNAIVPYTLASFAFALGGGWLCWKKIMGWEIPLTLLATLFIVSALHNQFSDSAASITVQMLGGGTLLAAFFIATDPVSAAAGTTGRIVYAAGIAMLIWLIRSFGGYPDGVAFAVLLMNCTVPALDYFELHRSGRSA